MPNPGDVPIYVGPEWTTGPVPLGSDNFGSIIYQPGGVSAGDTVATWPEVQSFITKAHGKAIVYVDDSITTPAPVPGTVGTTECFGRVELRPFSSDPESQTVLQIQAGATLLDLYAVRGRLELQCVPSASPASLDWTININGGSLLLTGNAILSNTPETGGSIANIADGKVVALLLETASIIVGNGDHPPFNIADGGLLVVQAFDGSTIENGYANGNGAVTLLYDMSTASNFFVPGTPPQVTIDSLYSTKNLDDILVEQLFTTSTINNNIFQNAPLTGVRPVTFRGVGGGGGGGGGSGGNATDPGAGGAGGGAPEYQEITVDVDFSHSINVVVDAGGPGGAGGTGGTGGAGANGSDGGPTYVLDITTNIVLCAFIGASAGTGGQTSGGGPVAISQGGSNISGAQFASGTGFVGAGGGGSQSGAGGSPGVTNSNSIGALMGPPDFSPVWVPGAGGTSGDATQGGGGGGGGQGAFGSGGAGGNCVGGVVTNGSASAPQSSAGGGGGAGGPLNGDGSSGGNGGSGQIISSYRP
jgi:hypothetical protein